MDELTNLGINKEDLNGMSTEELADLKIELEDLIMKCDELLNS